MSKRTTPAIASPATNAPTAAPAIAPDEIPLSPPPDAEIVELLIVVLEAGKIPLVGLVVFVDIVEDPGVLLIDEDENWGTLALLEVEVVCEVLEVEVVSEVLVEDVT